MVAAEITDEIIRLGWPVGQNIGRIPELMRRYGVSESIVREAVRQLEQNGLVRMLRGDRPGLVVNFPPAEVAAQALITLLHFVEVKPTEIIGFAHDFEYRMCCLSAQNLKISDIQPLRDIVAQLETGGEFIDRVLDFRKLMRQISAPTGNPLFGMFYEIVFQGMSSVGLGGNDSARERIAIQGDRAIRQWCQATERVISADLKGLAQQLGSFDAGEEFDRYWVEHRRLVRAGRVPVVNAETFDIIFGSVRKRSLFLAFQIATELRDGETQEGVHLGREPELTAKYGVSRGVFREAARILELHQICTMRRGIAGGMYAGRPSPAYAIQTARSCLRYLGVSPDQLREARLAFEPAAARRVAAADPGVAERLARRLTDDEAFPHARLSRFHADLMGAAGNRVVALVSKTLVDFGALAAGASEAAMAAARAVIEAIGAGDGPLAARQMVEFVVACTPPERQD